MKKVFEYGAWIVVMLILAHDIDTSSTKEVIFAGAILVSAAIIASAIIIRR